MECDQKKTKLEEQQKKMRLSIDLALKMDKATKVIYFSVGKITDHIKNI